MITDDELIAFAAKAAGLSNPSGDDDIWHDATVGHDVQWNPLEDDGDTLRLAIRLEINVTFSRKYVTACAESRAGVGISEHSKDRNAAVRLAILRVAAEIGKAVP